MRTKIIGMMKSKGRLNTIAKILLVVLIPVFFSIGCQYRQPTPSADGGAKAKIDITALEKQALNSPGDAKAWTALGNGLYDTSQWSKAIEAYSKALELDPKNVNVRVDLGTCYRNAGNPGKAIEEYRTGIAIDPNHKNARRNAGVVLLYNLDKPDEAIIEFEKYLELSPDNPDYEQVKSVVDQLRSQEANP